jgi:hypothetical protein
VDPLLSCVRPNRMRMRILEEQNYSVAMWRISPFTSGSVAIQP